MTQHTDIATPDNTISCDFPEFFKIAPIQRGRDRKKWKAPITPGWNSDFLAEQYTNVIPPGMNGGLCHKQSGTCAIDIDNLRESHELFRSRGLNLAELLMKGLQISSGKDNRSKLLYRLPPLMVMLGTDYPRTIQQSDANGMVLEFRCVYGSGNTCQDVLPGSVHPETNEVYVWAGAVASLADIPVIPEELMQWWQELMAVKKVPAPASWVGQPDTPDERKKIAKALTVLNPDMPEPEWRNIGLAINDTGWFDAFDIWDEWSAKGMNYDSDASWDKWEYMNPGRGINLNYLYSEAHKVDPAWEQPSVEELTAKFAELNSTTPAPIGATYDHATQEPIVDVMAMCEAMSFFMTLEEMALIFAHVAVEPSEIVREQYIITICDKTQLSRPMIRNQISELRQQTPQELALPSIVWPDTNDDDRPTNTIPNFEAMCNHENYSFRYNMMTRGIECIRPSNARPIIQDAVKLATLTELKSLSSKHGLRSESAKEHRDYMAYANHYHPFHDYLNDEVALNGPYDHSEPDYLQMLCNSIIVAPEHKELRDKLVRTWMVSVVAAAYMNWDLDRAPVRGVLVLQGPQRMGKSYWFEHLLPTGMVKAGASINKNEMNHLKTATNRLVVELAEAEFSAKNMDMVAYLKSIIGRSVDELRMAYDAEEVQLLRRSVFCMTTNTGTYLVDDENSRYFTVPAVDIDRDIYNHVINNFRDRMWLQISAMWSDGIPYLLDDLASASLQEMNEEHRAKTMFEVWLLESYHFESTDWHPAEGDYPESEARPALYGADNRENWKTLMTLMDSFTKRVHSPVSEGEARDILKRLTNTTGALKTVIDGVSGRYWKMPEMKNRII